MKTVRLTQGSPEWLAHRENYRNASEAPIVMNHSPYMKRNELMHYIKTGDKKAISDYVQKYVLDKGHRFEALARPLAEEIIGEDLSPLVGVDGEYSASFDGLTFFHDISMEHKSMNEAIRAANSIDDLPIYYKEQMEHQALVGNCERTLFLATRWEPVGEEDNEEGAIYGYALNERDVMTRYKLAEQKHFWYHPNLTLRAQIVAAWDQFAKDTADYVPKVIEAEYIPAAPNALPAITISADALPSKDSRDAYLAAVKKWVAPTNLIPTDKQQAGDLVLLTRQAKEHEEAFKDIAKKLDVHYAESDAVRKFTADLTKLFGRARIDGTKRQEDWKSNEKTRMVDTARNALADYCTAHNEALPKPYMPQIPADFWAAIKGKSSPESMQNDLDALLADKKIEADQIYSTILSNLATFDTTVAEEYKPLFEADLSIICRNAPEHFATLIKMRVFEHREEQARQAQAAAIVTQPAQAAEALQPAARSPMPENAPASVRPAVAAITTKLHAVATPVHKDHNAYLEAYEKAVDSLHGLTINNLILATHYNERLLSSQQASAAA